MKKLSCLTAAALSILCAASGWADVPFKVTTIENGQFAEGTTWYNMAIGADNLLISNTVESGAIQLGGVPTDEDKCLWCFVGDDAQGYQIYNKETGTSQALAASIYMSGQEGGSTYAILRDVEGLGSTYTNRWDFREANASTGDPIVVENGYFVSEHGYSSYILNNRDKKLAFWSGGYDNGSAIVIKTARTTFNVNLSQGTFTRTNEAGNYAGEWTSNASDPQLILSTEKNDMGRVEASGNLVLYSGRANYSAYSLVVDEGYVITGYSMTFKNASPYTYSPESVTADGNTYTATDEEQTITVDGLDALTAQFSLSGSNKGIEVTDFKVYVSRSFAEPETQQNLFITNTSSYYPYRIPAIAKARNGHLIALSDYRICGSDIGYGRVDIKGRISEDNGATWGSEFTIVEGTGVSGAVDCGFGDAAIVADAESDDVLLISVCGNTVYGAGSTTRQNPNRVARFYSHDNGQTWSAYEQITEDIYSLFDESALGPVQSCFFGSGRICQSRIVKAGTHYRLYAALCARPGGNRVVYSDDFGQTWHSLGSIDISPVPQGDEPKCEELPDGTVVISSRMTGGRYYNFYTYTNPATAEGSWGQVAASTSANDGVSALNNATNGEILVLPAVRNSDNAEVYVALQSVPFGYNRNNVGIYYKELDTAEDMATPTKFAANWDGRYQVSFMGSAYSTMVMQENGAIAFLYEESTFGRDYTTVYKSYTLDKLTGGAYTYKEDVDRGVFVGRQLRSGLEALDEKAGEAVGMLDAANLDNLKQDLGDVIGEYEQNPTIEALIETRQELDRITQDAYIKIEEGKLYTLENKSFPGIYLSADGSQFGAVASSTEPEQKFNFVSAGTDNWKIYNEKAEHYVAVTGAFFNEIGLEASKENAGTFSVESTPEGWSEMSCTNSADSEYNLIFLTSNDSYKVVTGYSGANAAQWRIVPTGEQTGTGIGNVEAETTAQPLKYYDLQGRQLKGAPSQGLYITSDKQKHLAR